MTRSALLCLFLSALTEAATRGSLVVRVLDRGEPRAGLEVTVLGVETALGTTDAGGRVVFDDLEAGSYRLSAGAMERRITIADELVTLHLDVSTAVPLDTGRFGRSDLSRERLERLPNAGTASSVLETLEPLAVTNRIDVAGVESAIDPLWSVRGSSWSSNRVTLDGLDVTDPGGGAALLYPDVGLVEEIFFLTTAHGPETAGPGTELRFVTRKGAPSFGVTLGLRATGDALQSENLDAEQVALGIEPREMRRYLAARFEVGAPAFYASASGLDMATRVPKFEPEEPFDLATAMGKLTGDCLSLLALVQRTGRPTFGAHPDYAPETTVDARETFQIVQASLRASLGSLRFGFARGDLESSFPQEADATPIRDLATRAVAGAPPVVVDRERRRWSAAGTTARVVSGHTLRAGFELSHATENVSEGVPGGFERLLVDGEAHAVDVYAGTGEVDRRVGLNRVALHASDAFFFDFLGRSFRLSPGVRLDDSRGGGIGWTHLSGSARGGMALTPSSEVHFGGGIYPHALTTELHRADEGLSWTRRRWSDTNGDGDATPNELGAVLRRGGGDFTTMATELPRPITYELTVGIEKHFRRGFLRFSGYQRWEKRLLQTVNVGVDPTSYHTFFLHDVGLDGVLGSADDVDLPVYDQIAQFGEDAFLLSHPVGLDSMAQGVDLLLGLDHGRFSWLLSGRAYRDVGSGNPGNDAAENDTGVIGELLDDPNTLTHAEGRLFFDRAFTGKLSLTARGPLGLRFGAAVRYWDGQPFARHLFFPDLGQGFTLVQAFPRGRLRYAFNMTVDVRAERDFELGRARLGLTLDAFNLFNQSLHTAEVVRSGMQFRDPTFVQPARTVVLQARLRF